jgi:NAD(P)-dependent dehydrogenase (short-subunit alcohol dehydrogenase family)
LSPGPIDTPALRRIGNTEEEKKAIVVKVVAATVLNRLGTPNEIVIVMKS